MIWWILTANSLLTGCRFKKERKGKVPWFDKRVTAYFTAEFVNSAWGNECVGTTDANYEMLNAENWRAGYRHILMNIFIINLIGQLMFFFSREINRQCTPQSSLDVWDNTHHTCIEVMKPVGEFPSQRLISKLNNNIASFIWTIYGYIICYCYWSRIKIACKYGLQRKVLFEDSVPCRWTLGKWIVLRTVSWFFPKLKARSLR